MAAKKKKKKAAPKKPAKIVASYSCPPSIPAPTFPCTSMAPLPTSVPKLVAELEAYFKCLCAWQQVVERVVNRCCVSGPENVPPPPPPPF